MLKQTVSYYDFDDNPSQETLYFNLTKTELADNISLRDELEDMRETFSGDKRELSTQEIKQLVDLVKTIMRLSYGVRSADGKRFVKTDELWTEFTQTAAYDEFLYSLFQDPDKAVHFMTGILPKDVRDEAQKEAEKEVAKASKADDISKKVQELNSPSETLPDATDEEMRAALEAYRKQNGIED